MATSLRIQELVTHIGQVYPRKVPSSSNKPTLRNSCSVCSLQNVDRSLDGLRRRPSTRRGVANSCQSNSSANHDCGIMKEEFIESFRSIGDGTFRLPVVDGQECSDKVMKRFHRERFKLPPVFDWRGRGRGAGLGGVRGGPMRNDMGRSIVQRARDGIRREEESGIMNARETGVTGGEEISVRRSRGGGTMHGAISSDVPRVGGAESEKTGKVGGAMSSVGTRMGGTVDGKEQTLGGTISRVVKRVGGKVGGAISNDITRFCGAVGGKEGKVGGVISIGVTRDRVGKAGNIRVDAGRLLALTSAKTFMSITVGAQSRSHLVVLSPDSAPYNKTPTRHRTSNPTLARIEDEEEEEEEEDVISDARSGFPSSRNILSLKKKSRKQLERHLGLYPRLSEDANHLHPGTLRYHHRQGSDAIFVPQNSFDLNFIDEEDGNRSTVSTGSSSLGFIKDDSSLVNSRGATFSEFPNGFVDCMSSDQWCRCGDVDINRLRCSECLKIGGHQRWCVSRMSLCPSCGKTVMSTMDAVVEIDPPRPQGVTTRTPSRSVVYTDSANRSGNVVHNDDNNRSGQSGYAVHNDDNNRSGNMGSIVRTGDNNRTRHGPYNPPNSELKVRFSSNDDIRSISPLESDSLPEEQEGTKPEVNPGVKLKRTSAVQQQRLFDVDVHKKAYELALSDSRVRKLKKSRNIDRSLNSSISGALFSYFPRWKQATSKSVTSDLIGFKVPDVDVKKIKRGMKHILGKIKIDDYYETIRKRNIIKT